MVHSKVFIFLFIFLTFLKGYAGNSCLQLFSDEKVKSLSFAEEVALSGINPNQLKLITEKSGGYFTFKDFATLDFSGPGTILGLDRDLYNVAKVVSKMTGYKHYWDSYVNLKMDPFNPNTEKYMSRLIESGEFVIFLVPRAIDGPKRNEKIQHTHNEFKWLFEGPEERLKNVIFVFGAYDAISKAEYETLSNQAFQQAVDQFGLPPHKTTTLGWQGQKKYFELLQTYLIQRMKNLE